MESGASQRRFDFEVDEKTYQLREAEFNAILFEVVITLVFKKQLDRVSYVLETGERELTGSGSSRFDAICVGLYRYLKEQRCHGPTYPELAGEVQSFRLHSIKDGLVAVAFFLKAGEGVPHFMAGRPDEDLLTVLDRGARTRLSLPDPELLPELTRLIQE
jgi:hypothetical protein